LEELRRVSAFFELLMEIDQKNKSKEKWLKNRDINNSSK